MPKINWKRILVYSLWFIVLSLLIYTRFVNLSWGLPYPMHPDERNMANAVQQLHCEISNLKECFNPHFFAYGQFPLYLGYGEVLFMKFFDGDLGTSISFQEAVFSLRIISAVASIITAFVLYKILFLLLPKKIISYKLQVISFLVLIFSPVLIQFAHFGTTESLLILFYSSIVYISILFVQKKLIPLHYLLLASLFSGLAIATKVSSLIFLFIPVVSLKLNQPNEPAFIKITAGKSIDWSKKIKGIILFFICAGLIAILFSPHNLISWNEFLSSIQYESGVALGNSEVFYTRQFNHTIPVIFQITKIFPYALGWPIFLLGVLGIIVLSWKKKEYNFLRLALILVFLPNAVMFAKWTRFMAPTFPIMLIFAILSFSKIYDYCINKCFIRSNLKDQKSNLSLKIKTFNFALVFALCTLIFALVLPGISYLFIYQNPDVRFQASEWIYKNIPTGTKILSETANVIDLPVEIKSEKLKVKNYKLTSFNFYDLDADKKLQEDLGNLIPRAEYIIVPSRRIFKNDPKEKYPLLNEYYQRLFSGKLGFKEIAEFTSYPKIELFGKKIAEFPDEDAEETWTVFDHPVIRIYKKKPTFFQ